MMSTRFSRLVPSACGMAVAMLISLTLQAQDASVARRTDANEDDERGTDLTRSDSYEPVLLRHRFTEGEIVQWTIQHHAETETQIQGNKQESRMSSVSTRQWKVTSVDANGQITFVQTVENVNMRSKLSDRPEVRYDSRDDADPPPEYSSVPETIGVPLATFVIDAQGKVIERQSDLPPQDLGLGDIVMPFPAEPVEIGQAWDSERELFARNKEGRRVTILTRQRYVLRRVQGNIAVIAVETQVMTPIDSPRIRSQIMQQMTKGTIRFDMEAGRIWNQEISWDEQVIGFDTPDSLMKYNAEYLQDLVVDEDVSTTALPISNVASSEFTAEDPIRTRDDPPFIRR